MKAIIPEEIRTCSQEIITIVETCLKNLDTPKVRDLKRNMSDWAFTQEFKKIILTLPRQTGQTSAALYLLARYPQSVLLTTTGMERARLIDEYRRKYELRPKTCGQTEESSNFSIQKRILTPQMCEDWVKQWGHSAKGAQRKLDLFILDGYSRFDYLQIEGAIAVVNSYVKLFVGLG